MKRDLYILVLCRLLQIVVSLVSLRIMTTLMSVEQVGEYYIFLSLFMLATLSVINPLGQYVNRFTYSWKKNGHLIVWMKRYMVFIMIFSLLFTIGYIVRMYLFHEPTKYIVVLACFLYISFVSINQFLLYSLNILDKRIEFSILTLLTASCGLIFACVFFNINYQAIDSVYLWILGIVLANFLSTILSWRVLSKGEQTSKVTDPIKIRPILNFCVPIAVSTFFMWIINSGYRFGVAHIMGISYLGILGVCFSVSSQIMTVVESLVTQILQPALYRKLDVKDANLRINYLKIYINECIAIYFCVFIFAVFFMHYIFLFLIDRKYLPFISIGMIAICSEFFRVSTNACSMLFFGEKDMKRNIYPYAIGSLILIIGFFSVTLIQKIEHSFLSIPIVMLISSFTVFISCFLLMEKYGRLRINLRFIFKRILVISPAIAIVHIMPASEVINIKQFINVGAVSCLYIFLLILSILLVKQNRERV